MQTAEEMLKDNVNVLKLNNSVRMVAIYIPSATKDRSSRVAEQVRIGQVQNPNRITVSRVSGRLNKLLP